MITLKPGDIFAENYKLVRFIATGGFAEVWEAIFLTAGNTVALKIFPKLDVQGVKNIEEEYKNQSDLLHTHLLVARYFGKYEGHPFLEMKYCSGGNAADKIGECNEPEIAKCLYNISAALSYLHDNDIIHQDIKPNNFLLDSNGNFFLADLGLSLKVRNTIKKFTLSKAASTSIATGLTPPPYRAPELYDRKQMNQSPIKSSDIWALGASLFELATGDVPFGEFGGMMQINDPLPPSLPVSFSTELSELIKKCLSKEAWDRPKAQDLLEWSQYYIKFGTWNLPGIKAKNQEVNFVDSQRTISNGALSSKTSSEISSNRSSKKKVFIGVALTSIIIVAFIIWNPLREEKAINPPSYNTDTFTTTPIILTKNEPLINNIQTAKTENHIENANQPASNYLGNDTTVDEIKKFKKQHSFESGVSPVPSEENSATSGSILEGYDTPKRFDDFKIEKIYREKGKLFVVFNYLNPKKESTNFSIYSPSDPDRAFYIQNPNTKGVISTLLKVTPSGHGIDIKTKSSFSILAEFEDIPSNIKTFNVCEGLKQDNENSVYWNFKNVKIK